MSIREGKLRQRPELTLTIANVISQASIFLATPVYSRLFSPEQLGHAATLIAFIQVFSIVAALRYDVAIMNARTEQLAYRIFQLSLQAVMTTTAVLAIAVYAVITISNEELINGYFLIPIGVLTIGLFQAGTYWHTKDGKFNIISLAKILQSLLGSALPIALHFIGVGFTAIVIGAICARSMGLVIYIVDIISNPINKKISDYSRISKLDVAYKFRSFPFFAAPQAFVNVASMVAAPIIFTFYGRADIAGHFWLADRILVGSISVFSISFGQVLLSQLKGRKTPSSIQPFAISNQKELIVIAPIIVLCVGWSIYLFSEMLFGPDWGASGKIAILLIPAVIMQFISSPLSVIVGLLGKNKQNFSIHIAGFLLRTLPVIATCAYNIDYAILVYALTSFSFYFIYNLWLLKLVGIKTSKYMQHFVAPVIKTVFICVVALVFLKVSTFVAFWCCL